MATTAPQHYGHTAGPSARPMVPSPAKVPSSAQRHAAAAANGKPTSSSPSKKKISMKKTRLPEVGATIRDLENNMVHITGRLLGQGGFARVYQVQGPDGRALAFKAIMKDALLLQRKNRAKVLAEILIHRSLHHPNIVHFIDLFQDEANVYFKLELCSNGSMNDMVRTRGACLDEEARFYMVQIIAGTKFMHVNHVIHRDLKLGNIFFDSNMNCKIGDFGLAALLKDPEERKKTMCGTPNYIAPEILYEGNGNGHSFEVDIWSVGVILFTLLAGKPPFQTHSVPAIYEKIRKNEYTIPEHVHPEAADLIASILTPDPSQRPSLVQIMDHPWFTAARIPLFVPPTATKTTPHLTLPRTMEESMRNLETVKRTSGWRDDADDELEEDEMTDEQRKQSAKEKRRAQERAEDERERMEREFELAIQPGSSLASFLQMGRKALHKAPDVTGPLRPKAHSGLSRQLSALSLSRQHGNSGATATVLGAVKGHYVKEAHPTPTPFLAADKENAGHAANGAPPARMMPPPVRRETADEMRAMGHKARMPGGIPNSGSSSSLASLASNTAARPDSRQSLQDGGAAAGQPTEEVSSMEVTLQNLDDALDAFQTKTRFVPRNSRCRAKRLSLVNRPDALNEERLRPRAPRSYIICWLDEMDKYGLGYALSDGTVGVYLKDDSSVATNANRTHFDHVRSLHGLRSGRDTSRAADNYAVPSTSQTADGLSRDVLRRFKVLSYFEQKIDARLEGYEMPHANTTSTTGMSFVCRWYRCYQAIAFRLSSGMVQFNFYDHNKVFISHDGLVVSAILTDRTTGEPQAMRSWTLDEFIDIAEKSRSAREQSNTLLPAMRSVAEDEDAAATQSLAVTSSEERKTVRMLMAKLKYVRDTLVKIQAKDAAAPAVVVASTPQSATTGVASRTRSASSTLARSNSGQSINSVASQRR